LQCNFTHKFGKALRSELPTNVNWEGGLWYCYHVIIREVEMGRVPLDIEGFSRLQLVQYLYSLFTLLPIP
jgi:hypothetical protein